VGVKKGLGEKKLTHSLDGRAFFRKGGARKKVVECDQNALLPGWGA